MSTTSAAHKAPDFLVHEDGDSVGVVVVEGILPSEGPLRGRVATDFELLRGKLLSPFGDGLFHFLDFRYSGAEARCIELDDPDKVLPAGRRMTLGVRMQRANPRPEALKKIAVVVLKSGTQS